MDEMECPKRFPMVRDAVKPVVDKIGGKKSEQENPAIPG
jgi:hypothetical protein